MVKSEAQIFINKPIITGDSEYSFIKFRCPCRQDLADWREISEAEIDNATIIAWQELLISASITPKLTPAIFNNLIIVDFQNIQKKFYELEWLAIYDITEKEFAELVSFLAFVNHWQESEIRLMPMPNIIHYQNKAGKLYEQSIPKY